MVGGVKIIYIALQAITLCLTALTQDKPAAADENDDYGWPTYMHDVRRSGVTSARLTFPLQQIWHQQSRAPIAPAWPEPKLVGKERWRNHFDNAHHPAVVDGRVFFGSIIDGRILALDAETGETRWTFATAAPVRLAPTVSEGRVYVGSDDGFVYCLNAITGELHWRFQAGPDRRRILGNDYLVSVWPVRTAIAVDDGVAYFGAGVFPQSPVYAIAVDAMSGKELWRTETKDITFDKRTLSPQGYILLGDDAVFLPSNRKAPFCFNRSDGTFRFYAAAGHARKQMAGVGTYGLLYDQRLVAGAMGVLGFFNQTDGEVRGSLGGSRIVVSPTTIFQASGMAITAIDRAKFDEKNSISSTAAIAAQRWKVDLTGAECMILTRDALLVGGAQFVVALSPTNGSVLWRTELVAGVSATGLAATGGQLFISTSTGDILAFGPSKSPSPTPKQIIDAPSGTRKLPARMPTSMLKGRALLVGAPDITTIQAICQHTEFRLHCLVADKDAAAALRLACIDAGLYGTRIWIDALSDMPAEQLTYPPYCFNSILLVDVSDLTRPTMAASLHRVLRPWGGTVAQWPNSGSDSVLALLKTISVEKDMAEVSGLLIRGGLAGAGDWTHQYANAGNTASSGDELVGNPLNVLWYGEPSTTTQTDRHHKVPAPLILEGRAYLQQEEVVKPGRKRGHTYQGRVTRNYVACIDVFNGSQYWRREIPGAYRIRLSYGVSNLALNHQGLFVAAGATCHQLDRFTGETLRAFTIPRAAVEEGHLWGYVAVADGTVIGSVSKQNVTEWLASEQAPFSNAVFTCDLASGEFLWTHQGVNIRKNTIAVSNGKIFFADAGELTEEKLENQRVGYAYISRDRRRGKNTEPLAMNPDIWKMTAVSLKTGALAWRRNVDLADCGGNQMMGLAHDGVLLFGGHFPDAYYHNPRKRMVALATTDGRQLWARETNNTTRPLIVGDTIHASPYAFTLKTGQPHYMERNGKVMMQKNAKTGKLEPRWKTTMIRRGCGPVTAGSHTFFYRSGGAAAHDERDRSTELFAATRPGCWINLIPANGVLFQAEASSGCVCNYSIQSTVVYAPGNVSQRR